MDLPLGSAVPPLEEALHVHDGTRAHEEHPIVRLCLHAIFVPVIRGWSIKNAERTKTPNPLFPRRQFCQYCRRDCNLTANFWFCWVLALSNHPITELGPLSTYQIPDLLSLGTPKLANHRARTIINQSDSGSAAKVGPEANQPLILSKLPLHGFRGLTVFGRDQHNKLCN